jgi:anti-anti-sigma factor
MSVVMSLQRGRSGLRTEAVAGGARVVVCAPHMDAGKVEALAEQLLTLAERVKGGRLEVDLAQVESLSDVCLGKLIALDRRLRALGRRLVLLDVPSAIYEVFEVTHLTGVLDVRQAA